MLNTGHLLSHFCCGIDRTKHFAETANNTLRSRWEERGEAEQDVMRKKHFRQQLDQTATRK